MTTRLSRRVGALLMAVGFVLLATGASAVAQTGDEGGAAIGFFDVVADSAGIGASFGNPAAPPYPVAAGLIPNSVAQLSAGPSGRAQASLMWPGPLIGNAGTLANVIGTPLPPEVVANANYPVVAQASAAGGAKEEKEVGPMKATVEGSTSMATTTLSDVSAPEVVTASRVVTTSRSFIDDAGRPSGEAISELQGVRIAGVIDIASVRTVARGSTDGVAVTTEQEVTLSGVTIGGQSATIDKDGIHLGEAVVPMGEALGGAQPALDGFGMKAFVTEPRRQESAGGAGAIDSGSVVFQWSPPESGQYFTVVLGGSSITVSGTPGSALAGAGGDDFFVPADPGTVLPTPSFSPSSDAGSVAPTDSFASADLAPATASSSGGATSGAAIEAPLQSGPTGLELTSAMSDRVPLGWVLVGIVGACLVGTGLHTFRGNVLGAAVAGTVCPLERSRPT